jgi:hypothetical protein
MPPSSWAIRSSSDNAFWAKTFTGSGGAARTGSNRPKVRSWRLRGAVAFAVTRLPRKAG